MTYYYMQDLSFGSDTKYKKKVLKHFCQAFKRYAQSLLFVKVREYLMKEEIWRFTREMVQSFTFKQQQNNKIVQFQC